MEKEQFLKRIDELEQRVRELESRPTYMPVFQPYVPVLPYEVTCTPQSGYRSSSMGPPWG
jgi:hypothetical protein